jgi:hypothetical protein
MTNSECGKFWDIDPQPALLNPVEDLHENEVRFDSLINAHGMYETLKFVLRLSPRNHELVDSITSSESYIGEISSDALQAYSTYLHETIHWWQHVGSTSGLLLSLSYLGQTHSNIESLKEVISKFGPKKPLKRWADKTLLSEGPMAQAKLADANIAVNNALDIEYYRAYALNPKRTIHALIEKVHFESIGHGYAIAYGQLNSMLSVTFDLDFEFLPKVKGWDQEFRRLTSKNHEGHYWRSPVRVPPVGLQAIYEGQARFIQLQFLERSRQNVPSVLEWREMGYLSGVYVEAFESFLNLSESEWPTSIDDPIVGLFLLICDLAINPTRAFPFEIVCFEDFIGDVDVGVRFAVLSAAVAQLPHLRSSIQSYSYDDYVRVADELTSTVGYDHPLEALEAISDWAENSHGLRQLMIEYEKFDFGLENFPVRVFFSHYVEFARDKLSNPEFFCWPGAWKAGVNIGPDTTKLWLRHLSLFTDRPDKSGIFPRLRRDRDEAAVKKTFENFYGATAIYDLTRQWILLDGEFRADYSWLFENYSQQESDIWANDSFKKIYGIDLSDFEIILD